MILGIDPSTSCVGLAIVDDTGKMCHHSFLVLRNEKTIFSKAERFRETLKSLLKDFNITSIFIEEPLQHFSAGGSSASVIAKLNAFGGVISWICYDVTSLEPTLLHPATARKMNGIMIPRGVKAKDFVYEHILSTEPDFVVEMSIRGNPRKENKDKSDAIVVAKAGWQILNNNNNKSAI